jgi:hypothetical protein
VSDRELTVHVSTSRKGPRNCRSLGFARDDKKERVAKRGGQLPTDSAVVGAAGEALSIESNLFWCKIKKVTASELNGSRFPIS